MAAVHAMCHTPCNEICRLTHRELQPSVLPKWEGGSAAACRAGSYGAGSEASTRLSSAPKFASELPCPPKGVAAAAFCVDGSNDCKARILLCAGISDHIS